MKNRLWSILLVLCMVLSLLPVSAFAAEIVDMGSCGENVTWTLNTDGILRIQGNGEITSGPVYTNSYIDHYNAEDVVTIEIMPGVTGIGADTFTIYRNVKTIKIPDSVTSIGDNAFVASWSLENLTIGKGVTVIGKEAFNDCRSLKHVTIPDSVTTIDDGAFYSCGSLTSVDIPDNGIRIGDRTFSACSSLASVTIPKSTKRIGNEAFSICSSLKSVTIPGSVTDIGEGVFKNCNGLASVTIGTGITSIGKEWFYYCPNLTSVSIPDSVTSIGSGAFAACPGLTSVTIPDSVISIGENAFADCEGLTSFTIPNSVKSIGGGAFYHCTGLTSMTIPNSVKSIGDSAFSNCLNLTSVTIPNSVTSIGAGAFSCCISLKSLTLPNSVTSISDYTFSRCESLTSITIPNSVTSIGEWAFMSCTNMNSVTIPNSVTSIGEDAFIECSSLRSVTIPNSVKRIEHSTFNNCRSLTSVTIPASVKQIDGLAFFRCQSLRDVYYGGTKTQWNQLTIGESNEPLLNATIHYASAPSPVPTETTSPTSPTAPTFENIEGKPISSKTNIAFNYNISETSTKGVWNLPYADSFLSGSAKKFHHDLAIISLGLTMASTNQTVGGKHTGAAYLQTMLEKMGFDKSSIQVSKQYADTQKQTDTCEYAFAVKKLTGSDDYLVCAVVRSNGYGGEWISNAHVFNGVNANHSAGFKGAADGMYTALQTYLNKLKVDKSHLRLWVTGFSRGGAVANLLGAKLTAESGIAADKIFVYGFAVPRTVQKTVKVRYENIFNIINQGDLVPRVPLQSWGYERYGIDKFLPCVSRNAGWYSNIQADMEKYFNKIMNTSVPTTIYSLMPAQERALDVLLAYLSDIIPSVYSYRSDGYQDAVMHACKGWQIDGEEISLDYITNRVFGMPAGHAKTLFGLFDDWSKQSKKEKALSVLAAIDLVTKWKDEDGTEQVKRVASAMLGYLVRLKAYEEADLINGAPYRELMNLISDQLARTKEKRNFASALLMQHWPETYLAWMMAGEEDEVFFDSSYQIMYIKCPVDVTVYDGNNRVAARIVNDKIDESIHGLYCEVNDYGEKIVFLPDDASYRTVVTAREKGAMDIVVQKYSAEDVLIDADCYISLPMQKSQTFQVNTASDSTVATNGKTLTPSKTLTESNRTVTISATAQNGGTVVGAGDYTLGATAELVAIPDTNYSFSGWYEKDKLLSAEDILHFSAVSDRTVTARFQKSSPSNPFTDVKSGAYYYDPVLWAVNHKPQITAGTSATTFSPDASCTRGQIVTFLWRANGQPEPTITKNPFTDVKPTDYFYKAVLWAVEKEITAGTSATTFSPAATVTRAQTVTFLWRAEGKPAATAKNPFTDVPAGQYYTDAVLWAVKNEITAGTSATTFSPANPCTRAQIVTFLYRDLAK